jgi:Domain of unknown function (DUF4160)
MPEISRFFGIVIKIFHNDHNPPHFHAIYRDYEALVGIEDLRLLRGRLPKRAWLMVLEWAHEHRHNYCAIGILHTLAERLCQYDRSTK